MFKKRVFVLIAALLLFAPAFASCGSGGAEEPSADISIGSIAEFESSDLNGNTVDQSVFQNADITMLNFWGTYCGPCIAEMPELATLTDAYEGRAQLIGVPIDVDFSDKDSSEYKAALEILETAGATFVNISPGGDIAELMESMQYVPTSVFVDAEGTIIGEPVIGANISEYKRVIEEYLSKQE